ncbi:MAG: prepilin-type N-terminal cleavage/methylation domain-containing protein [Alphaproteobacteria bacterium]|nr:prepilin-type N-terminal cleavage/methylation domain-containing protein [Alphaproteobacteria bacterium]
MYHHLTPSRQGFTLLEISIVLAVVALLAAGVTLGRSLVESAALQSVAADYDKYRQAVVSYREKYQELPGDHTNATSLTSTDGGCPDPTASDALTTATCNGDGNGVIGDSTGDPLGAFTTYNEPLLAWQHLMNEGLIAGKYNGRRSTAGNEISINVNAPRSKIDGASFMLRYFPTNTVTTGYFAAEYGHVFFFGAPGSAANLPLNGAALTTEQAKSIDLKIDDGKPGLGKVLTSSASVRACPTTSDESTAVYDGSISAEACALIFITGF